MEGKERRGGHKMGGKVREGKGKEGRTGALFSFLPPGAADGVTPLLQLLKLGN